jgi:3-hydroxyisobutyrate dehydrogenase-like beta-hydroxyacid dehydrogenase
MVQYRAPMILDMPDEAWFDFKMMQKDVSMALELGRAVQVPLPMTSVSNDYLTAGRAMGLGKKDFAAVFQVLARLSGVEE